MIIDSSGSNTELMFSIEYLTLFTTAHIKIRLSDLTLRISLYWDNKRVYPRRMWSGHHKRSRSRVKMKNDP